MRFLTLLALCLSFTAHLLGCDNGGSGGGLTAIDGGGRGGANAGGTISSARGGGGGGGSGGNGGGNGGIGGTDTGITYRKTCQELIVIVCDQFVTCQLWTQFPSVDDCVESLGTDCTDNCTDGRTFHADKVNACLEGERALTCETIYNKVPACDEVCTVSTTTSIDGELTYYGACMELVPIVCDQLLSCQGTGVFSSVEACTESVKSACGTGCSDGKVFHPDKARVCIDAQKTTTCATNTQAIPACDETCTDAASTN